MRQHYGTTEWGSAFLSALGELDTNGRLQRGKAIANKDQVYQVSIAHNVVRARVVGNYSPYYSVSLTFQQIASPDSCYRVIESRPLLMAHILNGELPLELLSVLRSYNFHLLPTRWSDMRGTCNCPDNSGSGAFSWGRSKPAGEPCKHQAAVYFALTTAIDKDPAVLFRLRGLDLHARFHVNENNGGSGSTFSVYPLPDTPLNVDAMRTRAEQADDNDEAAAATEEPPPVAALTVDQQISSQKQFVLKALKDRPAFCSQCDVKVGVAAIYAGMPVSRSKNQKKILDMAEKWRPPAGSFTDSKMLEQCQVLWRLNRCLDARLELTCTIPGVVIGGMVDLDDEGTGAPVLMDWSLQEGLPGFWEHGKSDMGTVSFRFASAVTSVAQTLLASHAVVPDVLPCPTTPPSGSYPYYRIIWKPLSSHPAVKGLVDQCIAIHDTALHVLPTGMVFLDDTPLSGEGAVLHALTSVLNCTMFENFLDISVPKALGTNPPEEAIAFFTGELYEANSGFGVGTDVGVGIRNWLRIFDLLKAHLTVRLVIEQQRHLRGKKKRKNDHVSMDEVFMLSLRFGKNYEPLPIYVRTCVDDHLRQSTYQFLSALNTYLPSGALDRLTLGHECCLEDGELEDFMIDCAPTLSALGVELVLPKMLEKLLKPRIVVSAKSPSGFQPKSYSEFLVTQNLMEFEYRVSLGDNLHCSISEWKRLVSQNKRLVEFNGRYVILDPAHVAHLLKELEDKLHAPPPAPSPIDLLQAAIGGKPSVILADGLEQFLSNMLRAKDVSVPSMIQATLRPYQLNGYQWIVNHARNGLGAILADDMGLGKTVQMIAAIAHFRQEIPQKKDDGLPVAAPAVIPNDNSPVSQEPISKKRRDRPPKKVEGEHLPLIASPVRLAEPQPPSPPLSYNQTCTAKNKEPPVLIVVPTTLLSNWSHELAKWAPALTYLIFYGGTRKRARTAENNMFASSDIVLTTYGTFRADPQALVSTTWSICILDEAQNIKNHSSAISKGVKLVRVTRARFALTGTPVENQLSDIHSLFEFCLPGFFPSLKIFSQKVSKPIERDNDAEEAKRLQQVIGPFVLRRMKTDHAIIADLPPKVTIDDSIALSPEQCAMYQCVLDSHFKGIENNEGRARRGAIFALIALLKQICNHPACMEKKEPDHTTKVEQSGKCVYLANMLEPLLAQGDKVLIFTQYIHMLELLHTLLQHRFHVPIVKLDGGMTRNARDAAVAQFQTDPNTQVFLISLKAGGVGLNLTAASHVVHFDRWWNPAVEDQATDRAFRIGQQKTVFVHKFTTVGTFEEKIAKMLEQKRSLGAMTVSEGESWLADMNDKELKDLFSLNL